MIALRQALLRRSLACSGVRAEWVDAGVGGEPCTWEYRLAGEAASCGGEPWRSGLLLPLGPGLARSPAGHEAALRAEGVPEGVPREPWRDMDLGVEVAVVRLLSAYEKCPAVSTHHSL